MSVEPSQRASASSSAMGSAFELFTPVGEDIAPDVVREAHKHLDPVHEAAMYIQDALAYTTHTHPRPGELARFLHLVQLYMQPLVKWALMALVLATFFELPAWCATDSDCKASLQGGRLTGAYYSGYPMIYTNDTDPIIFPLFGLPIMPPEFGSLIEMLILFVLLVECGCNVGAQGFKRFFFPWTEPNGASWLQPLYGIVLLLAWIDALVRVSGDPWPAGYFAPYLRIGLLCTDSPQILQELRLVRNTLAPLMGTAIVLFAFLVFSSWFGVLLYASPLPGSQGATYFTSLFETMWQLFICLTTANYPDVMMPAYTTARLSFSFFFTFIALGTFFLCNVVIAVVCNAYNAQVERDEEANAAFRASRLNQAFALLEGSGAQAGQIPRQRIDEVFRELNYYALSIARIDADRSRLLFGMLDTNREGAIGREDFGRLCNYLMLRFKKKRTETWITRLCPTFWGHPFFQGVEAMVRHILFEYSIDFLLICNAVVLIVEEWDLLSGKASEYVPHAWSRDVEIMFTILFTFEMSAKLAGLGWYEYRESLSNSFDGCVTLLSLAVLIFSLASAGATNSHGMIRYVLALRLGRFCRLLGSIPQVAVVAATFFRMVPAAAKLFKVLFVTMFVFSTVGVQLFGGLINKGPQYLALSQSDFGHANYWANNFNDLGSGFVVCFELLVVNNWFIITEGFTHVAYMPLVRLFFVAVYIFGVLVCLNIVIAFAIESFDAVKEANAALLAGGGNAGDTGDAGDGTAVGRMHSESILRAAERFKPVVPIGLQNSTSLKDRLKNVGLTSQRTLIQPQDARSDAELVAAGAVNGSI